MSSKNDKEGSGYVKAAIIGGVFAVIAALIGGIFLILNTLINNGSIGVSTTPQVVLVATEIETAVSTNTVDISCPSLSSEQIEQIKNQQDVASAIQQAERFAGYHQNDYKEGENLPANVVVATNLYANPSEFPVTPIKNDNGWGLFLTLESFLAPNAGTYWCIQQ